MRDPLSFVNMFLHSFFWDSTFSWSDSRSLFYLLNDFSSLSRSDFFILMIEFALSSSLAYAELPFMKGFPALKFDYRREISFYSFNASSSHLLTTFCSCYMPDFSMCRSPCMSYMEFLTVLFTISNLFYDTNWYLWTPWLKSSPGSFATAPPGFAAASPSGSPPRSGLLLLLRNPFYYIFSCCNFSCLGLRWALISSTSYKLCGSWSRSSKNFFCLMCLWVSSVKLESEFESLRDYTDE